MGGETAAELPCEGIGRHRLHYHWLFYSGARVMGYRGRKSRAAEQWELLYRTPYTVMVGGRLRGIRETRKLTQRQALARTRRPNGGTYSQGFLSRIEAGYANAPLYAYVHLSKAYELEPGRILGSDEAQKPITEAEMTVVKFLRRARISPDEALARLARR